MYVLFQIFGENHVHISYSVCTKLVYWSKQLIQRRTCFSFIPRTLQMTFASSSQRPSSADTFLPCILLAERQKGQ